jgi:putative flippase GtrA
LSGGCIAGEATWLQWVLGGQYSVRAMASTSTSPSTGSGSFVSGAVEAVKSKGLKYSLVSVVNVIIGQGLLLFFNLVVFHTNTPGMDETTKTNLTTLSNIMAVCISAVPAFYMSRAWVWGKKGKSHFKKEVLPFWIFIAVGLVFSTIVVRWTTVVADEDLTGTKIGALLPNVANMFAFGILWVLRFFLFDRLFHVEINEDDTPDEL